MTLHVLLSRQLEQVGLGPDDAPSRAQLAQLLQAVHRAYLQADEERIALERRLSLPEAELRDFYGTLRCEEVARRREAEGRYHALVRNLPGTAYRCRCDALRTIEYLSDGIVTLSGHDWKEDDAHPIASLSSLVHPDDRERVEREIGRVMVESGHYSLEYRVLSANGSVRWVHDRGQVTSTDRGLYLDGILRDDTERRDALEEARAARVAAEQATLAKSHFLVNMSHELRTPLNAVIGLSGLLMDEQLGSQARELTRMLRESATTLLELIDDVLDISKIEAQKLEIEVASFAVAEITDSLVSVLSAKAKSKGLELGVVSDPALPPLLSGDARRTRQLLLNLVSNAIKFTDRGEVRIEVRVVERAPGSVRVRFEVHDTGDGVPEHAAARIFEPFTQADASASRRYGGTGLGLAISRQLAELLGGSVGFHARAGGGSTFWFEAPFQMAGAGAPSLEKRLMFRRALVVDPSPYVRSLVSDQLSGLGAECSLASSPAHALFQVRELNERRAPCDFVVLGEGVSAELGAEFFAELARLGRTPRVLELCAFGVETRALDGPVHASVHKPLTTERLLAAVLGEPARKPSQRPPRRTFGNARVLVVEDNPANQRVVTLQLNSLGVKADLASDGVEALEALALRPYPLVLMDCQMPRMDGFEATRRLRERERGTSRRTRIVAFTANALLDEQGRCEEAGMDAVLTKPLMLSELERCLARFLGGSVATEQLSVPPPPMVRELAEIGGTSLVEEMLASFRTRETARLDALRAAIRAREAGEAVHLAHALKGVAAMSGFERLSSVLREVEEQLRKQAWAGAEQAAEGIPAGYEEDVAAVQSFLRRLAP